MSLASRVRPQCFAALTIYHFLLQPARKTNRAAVVLLPAASSSPPFYMKTVISSHEMNVSPPSCPQLNVCICDFMLG